MSDYIKREDAVCVALAAKRLGNTAYSDRFEIASRIRYLPAADVVEVVRCKDCIWHDHEAEEPGMVYCSEMVGGWVKSNFYCADGERRSE